jgi:hypothetical protein
MSQQPSHPQPDDGHLSRESVHAVLRAARFGIRAHPDPIGELIDRELRAYVDGGHQLPPRRHARAPTRHPPAGVGTRTSRHLRS